MKNYKKKQESRMKRRSKLKEKKEDCVMHSNMCNILGFLQLCVINLLV